MTNKKLLIIIATCLLSMSAFTVIPVFSVQPPVDTNTYYVGTIGQPRRVDPARAYDTASGELIMNVYETLIFFKDKKLMPLDGSTQNVSQIGYSNLTYAPANFKPVLATALPTISGDGLEWSFTIRENVLFHPWKDAAGVMHTNDYLTPADVEYSFERALVQDMYGSPSWMFTMPFFNTMFLDSFDADGDTNTIEPVGVEDQGEDLVAELIDNSTTVSGNVVTFHLYGAFPKTAFAQIMSQTWASIVNKDYCVENGCWNGSWYNGWSTDYRRMPSNLYGPLDRYYGAKSKYTEPNSPVTLYTGAMCGTGPFNFTNWSKATLQWRSDRFYEYWNGFGVNNTIQHIIVKGIPEWPTRKMLFLSGDYDSCAVPRANMYDLLDSTYDPISGITLYYDAPALSNDVASFVLEVAADTPYMPKVPIGGSSRRDFFEDPHTRTAFAYALNFTTYLRDAWFGEAIQPTSWWVEGLAPTAAKNETLVGHNLDLTVIQNELTAAGLWTPGFETYLVYNLGNDQRKIACEMIAEVINSIAPRFKVNVIGLDWPVFLDYEELYYMPMFFVGWLADFAHPDNFARPYMHSYGDFAYFQKYNDTHVDYLIDDAVWQTDEATQILEYQELQYIYWRDNPGLPLIQALGRRFQRSWVRGWYYNQLYPGMYFYDLYKELATEDLIPVDVAAFNVAMSPTNNITTHLIGQSYHAPRPGVAWFKKHTTTGASEPIVGVNASIKYYNASGPDVLVYAMWAGVTPKGHREEFGFYATLVVAGTSVSFGPKNISNLMPAVGDYNFWVYCFVLDPYAYNINVTKDFFGSWFNATGYCDTNGDVVVNMLDYQRTKLAVGTLPGQARWNWPCDVDITNSVTMLDYQKVKTKIPTVYTKS